MGKGDKVVTLPEKFIKLMPEASGDNTKVYLYLLLNEDSIKKHALNVSDIADHFMCMEKDILRSLLFWKEKDLLRFSNISDPFRDLVLSDGKPEERTQEEKSDKKPVQKNEDELEFYSLVRELETCLGHPLSTTDIKRFAYLHDNIGLSYDLLHYLIDYSSEHMTSRNISYVEKVGLSWHQKGIRTVEEAKAEGTKYPKEYYELLREIGITGRNVADSQAKYFSRWLNEYQMPMEVIRQAIDIAHQNGACNFNYINEILKSWDKKGIRSLEAIAAQEEEYKRAREKNRKTRKVTPAPNRFHNFHQRDYDYDDLEQKLLKSQGFFK